MGDSAIRSRLRVGDHLVLPDGVYRSTTAPLTLFRQTIAALDSGDDDALRVLLATPEVCEAFAFSSRSLLDQIERFVRGEAPRRDRRFRVAIARYVSRWTTRPTPLGMFGGVGRLHLEPATTRSPSSPIDVEAPRRHLVMSAQWSRALAARLAAHPDALDDLQLVANPTLVDDGVALRVVVPTSESGEVSVLRNHLDLVRAVLDRAGTPLAGHELLSFVGDLITAPPALAAAFVHTLIRATFLCPTLIPSVAVHDASAHVARELAALAASTSARWPGWSTAFEDLCELRGRCDDIDLARPVAPATIDRLTAAAGRLLDEPAPDVHLDLQLPDRHVPPGISDAVYWGAAALAAGRFTGPHVFVTAVRDWLLSRFGEGRWVRLADVFAPDTGVELGSRVAGAIHDGRSTGTDGRRSPVIDHLLEDGHLAADTVDLWACERGLVRSGRHMLPDAFVALARSRDDAPLRGATAPLVLRSLTGGTGSQLLSRFATADARLRPIIGALADHADRRPGCVHAEVVTASTGRSVNVASRASLGTHHLPLEHTGGLDPDSQAIAPGSLLVSVQNGAVVLWSPTWGRVIPRSSIAVNPRFCSSDIGAFLVAMAWDGSGSANWSWGRLASVQRLPRVTVGRCVLAPRQWRLDQETFAAGPAASTRSAVRLRELPQFVTYGSRDRELVLDLRTGLGVRQLERACGDMGQIIVREAMQMPADGDPDDSWDAHVSEWVLPYVRPEPVPTRAPTFRPPNDGLAVARRPAVRYGPGSKWLSLHLYGRPEPLDRLLRARIAPRVLAWLDRWPGTRWHFLRYVDLRPDNRGEFHLRVRARGGKAALAELRSELWHLLRQERGRWARATEETYIPEVDRYGGRRGLVLAERLFDLQSTAVMSAPAPTTDDEAVWRAVEDVDRLLLLSRFAPRERAAIAQNAAEHVLGRLDPAARHAAHQLARSARQRETELILAAACRPGAACYAEALTGLLRQPHQNAAPPSARVASSWAHMHCNRSFATRTRLLEATTYLLLARRHKHTSAAHRDHVIP